ncbi:MAG: tetratricopeptide repeat protein [Saprospiraceae bacterium]|nr:tetratricopeptide repeat protein [Saprospiraceae bacterium]
MDKEQLLTDLQNALDEGNIFKARDLVVQALETYPNEAFGYYYRGELCSFTMDTEGALEAYTKAVELEASSVQYKLRLAHTLIEVNDIDRAEDLCDELMEMDEDNPKIQFVNASFHLTVGTVEDAAECLSKAVELDPEYWAAWIVRANLAASNRDFESAMNDIEVVLAANPKHVEARKLRISFLEMMDPIDWEAIKKEHLLLLEVDENDIAYLLSTGSVCMYMEDYLEAEEYFDRILQLTIPQQNASAEFYKNRGLARLYQEKYAEAIDDFRMVTDLDEEDPEGYLYMSEARNRSGDFSGAVGYLELGLDMVVRGKFFLYKKMGELFMDQGNLDRAEGAFKQMTKDETDEGRKEGFYCLGIIYHKQGDLEEAYKAWVTASESFHMKADEMINLHCKELLEAEMKEGENEMIEAYAEAFEQNKNNAVLQKMFAKIWKVDLNVTTKKNKMLADLPADIKDVLMTAFENLMLILTHRGFIIFNPGHDHTRALYRIEKAAAAAVRISGQPLNQGKPQNLDLGVQSGYLIMGGLGGPKMSLKLFLKEADSKTLAVNHRKELQDFFADEQTQYLGEELQTILS